MNVAELIERGEGKTVEFKRDISSPQNIVKTVSAFANTAGGVFSSALITVPENHLVLVILWMLKNACATWLPTLLLPAWCPMLKLQPSRARHCFWLRYS